MTEAPSYTATELRARLRRRERVNAAIDTYRDMHWGELSALVRQRVEVLPDGRLAITTAELAEYLQMYGRRVGETCRSVLMAALLDPEPTSTE
jgi:hypothetical protein